VEATFWQSIKIPKLKICRANASTANEKV